MNSAPVVPVVDTGMALGRQLTVEYYDCNPRILADPARMEEIFLAAARESGATVVSSHFHAFAPQGVSGVVIISESHFAVHAWPENDYAAVDIFTCGDSIDFDAAVRALQQGLESLSTIISSVMNRGIVNNFGVERLVAVCEDQACRYSLSWRARFDRTRARGISTAIDLYDCPPERLQSPAAAEALVAEIVRAAGTGALGELRRYPTTDGMISLRQDLADGLLSAHLDPESGTVYCDIFLSRFFEPRPAAEAALAAFGGHHYRMQVAIRQ